MPFIPSAPPKGRNWQAHSSTAPRSRRRSRSRRQRLRSAMRFLATPCFTMADSESLSPSGSPRSPSARSPSSGAPGGRIGRETVRVARDGGGVCAAVPPGANPRRCASSTSSQRWGRSDLPRHDSRHSLQRFRIAARRHGARTRPVGTWRDGRHRSTRRSRLRCHDAATALGSIASWRGARRDDRAAARC